VCRVAKVRGVAGGVRAGVYCIEALLVRNRA